MLTFCLFTGDITQKGYEKKRTRLLAPYVPKQAQGMFLLHFDVYECFHTEGRECGVAVT